MLVRNIWIFSVAGLLGLAMSIVGLVQANDAFTAVGVFCLVLVAVTAPFAFSQPRPERPAGGNDELVRKMQDLSAAFDRFSEMSALSDDARRVLNRRRERELLRAAIEEDITAEDWDAAMVLTNELADRFGYRQDAEEFRERIETARYETVARRVNAAVTHMEALITARRWEDAVGEAARIERLYPDSPRARGLVHRVERSLEEYKKDIERRFLVAAQEERVDEAMSLLKELDHWLSPDEAARLQEVARGVIGRARENLGVQFKLAVQDRRWRHAAEIGERIIEEFPNTRMAGEIREMIDAIRERASAIR